MKGLRLKLPLNSDSTRKPHLPKASEVPVERAEGKACTLVVFARSQKLCRAALGITGFRTGFHRGLQDYHRFFN